MISPQEPGTIPSEVTVTMLGDEVGSLMAWLAAFPFTGPCVNKDSECKGINEESLSPVCTDCADMIRIGNHIKNLRGELNRQWQIAAQ